MENNNIHWNTMTRIQTTMPKLLHSLYLVAGYILFIQLQSTSFHWEFYVRIDIPKLRWDFGS